MEKYAKSLSMIVALVLTGTTMMLTGAAQIPDPDDPLPEDVNVPFTPIATAYAEDFATDDGNYTVGGSNPSWAFGQPTSPPDALPGVAPNMWGTNLNGPYNNQECSYLQSPTIDLSEIPVGLARLSFSHYTDIESKYDGAVVMVSANGDDWSVANPTDGYDDTLFFTASNCLGIDSAQEAFTGRLQEWRDAEFDVSDFVGGDLHVRWAFGTDFSVTDRGWYIDDVTVEVGVGANIELPGVPNPNDSLPDQVDVPFTAVTTAYAEDFATDDGDYTVGGSNPSWAFGQPTSPPDALPGVAPNMWGTNLAGDYNNLECSYLQSPAIDLSEIPVGLARLSFSHYTDIESFWDGAIVMVSANGDDWSVANPTDGYDDTLYSPTGNCLGIDLDQEAFTGRLQEWRDAEIDVSDFVGGDLHVRWAFSSDSIFSERGWYIDDVTVEVGIGATVDVPEIPIPGPEDLPNEVSTPFVPLMTAYSEDFATDDGDYTVGGSNPSWAFGQPTSPPDALPGVAPNMWGTNLNGPYNNQECSYLQSPAIDLSEIPVGLARLSFSHYTDIESKYDGAVVMVSANGDDWSVANPTDGYDDTLFFTASNCLGIDSAQEAFTGRLQEWRDAEFDVSDFVGGDLHVRWAFGTDFSVTDQGWYIDDIVVETGLGVSQELSELPDLPS